MRRSPALVLALALVASMLALASFSPASAEPPGDTPDTGSFSVDPVAPATGDTVKLTGNFASGTFEVSFYKKVGDGEWTLIDTDQSNASGNAYLYEYQVNEAQDVYARITSGSTEGRTEVDTITPTPPEVVMPDGPVRASFSTSPETYADGDEIIITANFPSGVFGVTLYQETAPDVWTKVGFDQSNSSGNAYINYTVDGSQKVFARKSNGERTEVNTIAPSPDVTLSIQRDCTGNTCAQTATATGELDPAQQDRSFVLQYLSGSTWRQIGSAASTDADGKVEVPLDLDGISQWTARSYRLFAASDESGPGATSNTIQFMPGPTELGNNVLRVDVEDGVFPSSKSREYTGEATLSQGGDVKLDHVPLEDFGVRGNSTASYSKKPYKLKFEDSPKDVGVFGMEADKSWTLLASFLDQTFVRDKVGLDLGRALDATDPDRGRWTPDTRFVELFVNDQYRGSYVMTESVKIDGDRVDVEADTGMIMEVDNALSSAEDFMSSTGKIVFAFKDPDERKKLDDGSVDDEGVTDEKLSAVRSRINAFETKLYSSSGRDEYEDFIDEKKAIDFQFIKEFTKDNDSDFNSSHYFSWDMDDDTKEPINPLRDGKFHFGPVWDFDRSAGNVDPDTAGHKYVASPTGWMLRGTGTPSDSGRQLYRSHWFVQLFKDPAFKTAVETRWDEVKGEFKEVADSEVAAYKAQIGVGAANDRNRWKSEPKRYDSNGSYDDEIDYVTKWYRDRYNWMDGQLD